MSRVSRIEVGVDSSSPGAKYQFSPPTTNALVGTVIVFDFSRYPGEHSVIQSTFDNPCQPLAGGFDSGVVTGSTTNGRKEWNLTLTDTAPIWFYCGVLSPTPHCNLGMVGVINAPAFVQFFPDFLSAARTAHVGPSSSSTPPSSPTSPSLSSSASQTSSVSTTTKSQTAIIAGSVVGGVVGLCLFALAFFLCWRRRAARRAEKAHMAQITAFPAEPNMKEEVERLRAQVQRLESERRTTSGGTPSPEGTHSTATDMVMHTDSGLRLGPMRVPQELPPQYVAD